MDGCRADTQSLGIHKIFLDVAVCNDIIGHTFRIGLIDDLIINIGEVLYKLNLIATVFQIPAQDIKNNERTCVADMEEVIHRRAAGIHLYFSRLNRNKFFLLPGH